MKADSVSNLARLMRLLTAMGIGEECGEEMYSSNEAARLLCTPANRGGVHYL